MKIKTVRWALACALLVLLAPGQAEVLLHIAPRDAFNPLSNKLFGASNLEVLGDLYTVEFVPGDCVDIYDGCDSRSDFPFRTISDAQRAVHAVFRQVLRDSPLGNFDTLPSLVFGCDVAVGDRVCLFDLPYTFDSSGLLQIVGDANTNANYRNSGGAGYSGGFTPTGGFLGQVLLRWTLQEPIDGSPIPVRILPGGVVGVPFPDGFPREPISSERAHTFQSDHAPRTHPASRTPQPRWLFVGVMSLLVLLLALFPLVRKAKKATT